MLTKLFGAPSAVTAPKVVERNFEQFNEDFEKFEAEYVARKRKYDEARREWPAYKAALDAEAERREAQRLAAVPRNELAAKFKEERRQRLRAVAEVMRSKVDTYARDFALLNDGETIAKWFGAYSSQFATETPLNDNYVLVELLHADGSVSSFRSARLRAYFEIFEDSCNEPSDKVQEGMYQSGYGLRLAWIRDGSVRDERYFGLHARLGCNVRTDDQ